MYYYGKGGVQQDYLSPSNGFNGPQPVETLMVKTASEFSLKMVWGPLRMSEAVRLYRAAAEQGQARGQANLARMYEHGAGGLARDYSQALLFGTR